METNLSEEDLVVELVQLACHLDRAVARRAREGHLVRRRGRAHRHGRHAHQQWLGDAVHGLLRLALQTGGVEQVEHLDEHLGLAARHGAQHLARLLRLLLDFERTVHLDQS